MIVAHRRWDELFALGGNFLTSADHRSLGALANGCVQFHHTIPGARSAYYETDWIDCYDENFLVLNPESRPTISHSVAS
jgi:hypothetical protein